MDTKAPWNDPDPKDLMGPRDEFGDHFDIIKAALKYVETPAARRCVVCGTEEQGHTLWIGNDATTCDTLGEALKILGVQCDTEEKRFGDQNVWLKQGVQKETHFHATTTFVVALGDTLFVANGRICHAYAGNKHRPRHY